MRFDPSILLAQPDKADAFMWATVTSVDPLLIRFDTETEPLTISPTSLVDGLYVGSRVWCQIHNRRVLILSTSSPKPYFRAGATAFTATVPSNAPGTIISTNWTSTHVGFEYNPNGTWTVPVTGIYGITAKVTWPADVGTDWPCGVQVWDGDTQIGNLGIITLHSKVLSNSSGAQMNQYRLLEAGTELRLSAWMNASGNRTPNGLEFSAGWWGKG